jgi:hypothetical protein
MEKEPALKVTLVWLGLGAAWAWDWPKIASILAALFSLCLLMEWLWKRIGRPLAEKFGWVKKKKHRIILLDEIPSERGAL